MKYYIPISSLNLDNILQSESISPIPFYDYRTTGYKTFNLIPELRGINQIVLFEYPVKISINDNRYNYPVLIEIEDDNQLQNNGIQKTENGICLYNRTLYLTPYNCRIFFFSEKSYKLVTINTKDNKSIKYYHKYRIYPTAEKLGALRDMPPVKMYSNYTLGECIETQNDKKKGVLYACLLGQYMSVTSEVAHQKYLTQEIYNIYAGIRTYLKTNSPIPEVYIKKLAEQLDAYKAIDQIELKNQLKFNECFNKDVEHYNINAENLIELLNSWGEDIWHFICRKLSHKYNAHILPCISELHFEEDYSFFINQIENHTKQCIETYREGLPKPTLSIIKIIDNSISINGKPLLNIAIKFILDHNLTQDKLVANRSEICSKIINRIRDYFISTLGYDEQQWKEDPHRHYALQLYNSINNHLSSFSLNDALKLKYGPELRAIAAFILRGENIDSYLKYLLKNEFTDYSMPLALWGVLCGYMEMNRDLFSGILSKDTYENVYELLNGTSLSIANFNDFIPSTRSDMFNLEGLVLRDDYLFVIKRAKIKAIYTKLEKSLHGDYISIEDVDRILKECNQRSQDACNKARIIFNKIANQEYNDLRRLVSPQKEWINVAEHFGIKDIEPNKLQEKQKKIISMKIKLSHLRYVA